jgi:hypothetical protein
MDPYISLDLRVDWKELMEQTRASQPPGQQTSGKVISGFKVPIALPRPLGRAARAIFEDQNRIVSRGIDALPGPLRQQMRKVVGDLVVVPELGDVDPDHHMPLDLAVDVPTLKKTFYYEVVAKRLSVQQVLLDVCARLSVELEDEDEVPWLVYSGHKLDLGLNLGLFSKKADTEHLRCALVLPPGFLSRLRHEGTNTTVYWKLLGRRGPIRTDLDCSVATFVAVLREDEKFHKAFKERSSDIVDADEFNLRLSLDGAILMSDATLQSVRNSPEIPIFHQRP